MRGLAGRLACVVLLGAAGTAMASSITGTVALERPSDGERTVVYIENVPEGTFSVPATVPRLSQRGATFSPALLPVVRGAQVDMTNDDWVGHNVFSKSAVKTFDLGLYAKDARKVVTFDRIGPVSVFCSIHARMNAVILVLQNPFFVKPAPDGSFLLDNVPPGTYQLKVYRSGVPSTPGITVKVPTTGSVSVRP